jgi:hypothetical protein
MEFIINFDLGTHPQGIVVIVGKRDLIPIAD